MTDSANPTFCPNSPSPSTPEEGEEPSPPSELATPPSATEPRGTKTITIPCDRECYPELVENKASFREHMDRAYREHPELFPEAMSKGYTLDGFMKPSEKLKIRLRRIKLAATGEVFSVCPSFVMPYMTGYTKDVEHALFLLGFGVPYWALTHVYGRNDMYWYRQHMSFGRNSIVGTTVKDPESLPKDIVADEKHTKCGGEKAYVATTVGKGCVLGASVCASADAKSLIEGYKSFADEARNVEPDYSPETVNTDGWDATQIAWKTLFPGIVVILCFLHSFIKIRDRCKNWGSLFNEIASFVWEAYHAENKRSFGQRIRRLREWAQKALPKGVVLEKILALCAKGPLFSKAYDHPNARRTSNMLDRLMRRLDRALFNRQDFHGSWKAAELGVRSWAILANYRPYSPRAQEQGKGNCAAERLNGFRYHENWLENLRIASSMGGFRR